VAITIPLHNNINSYAIVFFCTAAAISCIGSRIRVRSPWLLVTGLCFLSWMALTFFWDSSGGFTVKSIEGYAGFLFFPLFLSIIPLVSLNTIRQVCLAFIVSVTVVCLICLVLSIFEYQKTGDSRLFYYHYLSQQLQLNAIFLSNYCTAGIGWLLYFWFVRSPAPAKPAPGWIIAWCIVLFSFVFLLSSKLVIFLMLLIIACFLVYIGKRRNQLAQMMIVLAVVIGTAALAVNKLYYLRWRLSVTELKNYSGDIDNQNGLAARLLMWRSTAELIGKRPVEGYGLRGAPRELFKKFEEKKFNIGIENRYNSHNQYLQTALSSGLIGLGLFLAFLGVAWARAIKYKNLLMVVLLLHFMIISIVESTLEVQQELIFFLFFILFFYFHLVPALEPKKFSPKK
jgi:O-antigen ligase